jgi:hypothetical protein
MFKKRAKIKNKNENSNEMMMFKILYICEKRINISKYYVFKAISIEKNKDCLFRNLPINDAILKIYQIKHQIFVNNVVKYFKPFT